MNGRDLLIGLNFVDDELVEDAECKNIKKTKINEEKLKAICIVIPLPKASIKAVVINGNIPVMKETTTLIVATTLHLKASNFINLKTNLTISFTNF